MDKLTVYSPAQNCDIGQSEPLSVDRIEKSIYLQPGTYWLCNETHSAQNNLDNGRGFKAKFVKGDILLLRDIHVDETGYIHNVELLLTPEHQLNMSNPSVVKLLVDDFHRCFTYDENGENTRKKQVADETNKLLGIQLDLSDIQTSPERLLQELNCSDDEEFCEVKERLKSIKSLPTPDAGTNVSSLSDAEDSKMKLEAKVEFAKATEIVLKRMTGQLTSQVSLIGAYHGEVGHLALARTKEAREVAEKVSIALSSLDIYLGKDVEVHTVKTGKSGDSSEKYKIYQDMLFIDEESLIHAGSGGADFKDVNKFLELVNDDPTLVDRLFPFERSVIIIRPRRKIKEYKGASPFESSLYNYHNTFSFLMIRNGENIHAIFHPMGFMDKLFPSIEDMEKAFTFGGWGDCRNVTKDDIEYTASLQKAESLRRQYKRLVLMLQGVYERDESGLVLGDMPLDGPLHLLNPDHQAKAFDFVSLENAIHDERMPIYGEWLSSLNKNIRVGSLVCFTSGYVNRDNTPGVYSRNEENNWCNWDLQDSSKMFDEPRIIEKHGDKLGVKNIWVHSYESKERSFLTRVDLSRKKGIFDLENLRSSHIDYYLNSRKERINYVDYIDLLLNLKSFALIEEGRTLEAREALTKVIRDSGREVDQDVIFQSVMKYRANNKGAFPENCHLEKIEMDKMVNVYWQLSGGGEQLVKKIISKFPDNKVLCIVTDAKNNFFTYVSDSHKSQEFDNTGFPWLTKYKLVNADNMIFSEMTLHRISEIQGKFTFIYQSDDFKSVLIEQNNRHKLTARQFKNWKGRLGECFTDPVKEDLLLLEQVYSGNVNGETIKKLLRLFEDDVNRISERIGVTTYILKPLRIFPLGLINDKDGRSYLMTARVRYEDVISLAYSLLSDDERMKYKNIISTDYGDIIRNRKAGIGIVDSSLSKEKLSHNNLTIIELGAAKIGALCWRYDNFDDGHRLSLSATKTSYWGMINISQIEKPCYVDEFLMMYPNLSKSIYGVLKTGHEHDDKKDLSFYDFKSEMGRLKLANNPSE